MSARSSDGADTDATTAGGQNLWWDAYIFRYDGIGRIMGQTAVLCDGPMVMITVQAELLINANFRHETNAKGLAPAGLCRPSGATTRAQYG